MSNTAVGSVYAKIIQDVLEASQVDFEEGGVDQSTLDRLRQIWQGKLSSIKVAQFPWDPAPPTPAASSQPAPVPVKTQPSSSNATPAQTPPASSASQAPSKTEPSQPRPQPQTFNPPQLPQQSMANMTAQQRAAAALQQKFGQQAAPQVAQLQGQAGVQQRQATSPAVGSYPTGSDSKPSLSSMQQMQQAQQRSSLPANQTDGASDSLAEWKAEVARRRALEAGESGEGDRLIREYSESIQQRMEGGGLLLPLEERYPRRTGAKRKVHKIAAGPSGEAESSLQAVAPAPHPLQQFDGGDDDDDDDDDARLKDGDDEDAINSDLDDPDELAGDPDADAETDQAMLCTYDKVQRVKNKWKCTLKDGILKADGKEYVFHKGQGEFEW